MAIPESILSYGVFRIDQLCSMAIAADYRFQIRAFTVSSLVFNMRIVFLEYILVPYGKPEGEVLVCL